MIYNNSSRLFELFKFLVLPIRTGTILNGADDTGNGNLERCKQRDGSKENQNNVGDDGTKQQLQKQRQTAADETC